jgi:tetratricopeptide (TPR) repeat protein
MRPRGGGAVLLLAAVGAAALHACAPGETPASAAFSSPESVRLLRPFHLRPAFALEYRPCGSPAGETEAPLPGARRLPGREPPGSEFLRPCAGGPLPGDPGFEEVARRAAATRSLGPHTHPDPAWDRAMGVWELLWHRHSPAALDRAIHHLRRAAEAGETAAWVELAVAHHERASARGAALDRVEALSAAERAWRSRPHDAAAAFNRAWILQELGLHGVAAEGWDRVLAMEEDPRWLEEARTHRSRAQADAERTGVDREALRTALLDGPAEGLRAGAGANPQLAREVAFGPLLARWLDAGSHSHAGATRGETVRRIALLGDGLADGSVAGLARVLAASPAPAPGGGDPGSVTGAVSLFLGGERLLQEGRPGEAVAVLERAHSLAAPGPLGHWIRLSLAAARFSDGDYLGAGTLFGAPLPDGSDHPVMRGRGEWGVGLIALRSGDYGGAWRHLQAASGRYAFAGEADNRAFLQILVAESLKHLGRHEESWRARLEALRHLATAGPSQRLHSTLWEAGDAAERLGHPEVARLFLDGAVQVATALDATHLRAEAHLKRARHHLVQRDAALAAGDLESARPLVGLIPPGDRLRIARAHLWTVEGSLLVDTDPGRALAVHDSLLQHHRSRGDGLGLVDALRGRGRALRRAGEQEAYEATLDEALTALEAQGGSLGGEGGAAFARASREALSEAVGYWGVERRDAMRALHADQRGRLLVLPRGSPPPKAEDALALRIPDGVTVVQFAVLEERVLRWTLSRARVALDVLATEREELELRAAAFLREVLARSPAATVAGEALASALELGAALGLDASTGTSATPAPPNGLVAIIPDGFLARIPFAALPLGEDGRLLVERHPLVVAPHLAFLLDTLERERPRAGRRGGPALLVGAGAVDPALLPGLAATPLTEEELVGLARLHPGGILLSGPEARREPLLRELPGAELFHYAGHAVHDPVDPAGSHLVLTPGAPGAGADLLTARELETALVRAPRLVILSACSSAVPTDALGGGFWGIGFPFLRGGSSAVVGTLWAVEDGGALRLQAEFHRAWLDGLDTAAALRQAQLTLLRDPDPRLAAPATWAAFQGMGIAL